MPPVETALGPVPPSAIGFTLSHEHVVISDGRDLQSYPWMFDRPATVERSRRLLCLAKQGGVDTIIDLTTPDLGRDAGLVIEAAGGSGVNVVLATGIWRDIPRSFYARDPDAIAEIFTREIAVGIDDAGAKAGVIKVAHDREGVTPAGELILRGAARAAMQNGCPISTHHYAPGEVGARQVEILRDEGVDMELVAIGHSADTTDVDYLESLLRSGVFLSMDRYPGGGDSPSWEERNATVRALVERGWAGKLMLGHDFAPPPVPAGGQDPLDDYPLEPYLFVSMAAVPALIADGVAESDIELMTRVAPRRFLAHE